MAEENKTGEGAADLKKGENSGVADLKKETGNDIIPDAGESKDVEGLKQAAIEERKKRQHVESQLSLIQEQMALMQANPRQQEQHQQEPQDYYSAVGLGPDDYPTVGQQRQIDQMRSQQQTAMFTLNQFVSQHPDFNEVVGTVGPNGQLQFSPQLLTAIKEQPGLINQCSGPFGLINAYNAVKLNQLNSELKSQQSQTEQDKLAEQIRNAERIGSASSVGGSAALNRRKQVMEMSDEEFRKFDEQVARGQIG